MSEEQLSEYEQDEIVAEMVNRIETMSEDEREELYNQLDAEHQSEVDEAIRDFADNAVGDEHWDSDR